MKTRPGSRRSVIFLIAAALGVGAWATPQRSPVVVPPYQITEAQLACPATTSGRQAGTVVGLIAVAGLVGGNGRAALAEVDTGKELAAISSLDSPLLLLATGAPQAPLTATATGWGAALLAGQASRTLSGQAAGMSSAACLATGDEWWFVGASSRQGRRDTLLVTNPAAEAARFDVELLGRDGVVEPVAGRGVDIAGRTQVALRLDAIAPDQDVLAGRVVASAGRVAVALRTVATAVDGTPQGVDFLAAGSGPDTSLVFPGLPSHAGDRRATQRTLYLANPGEEFATANAIALTDAGPAALTDLSAVVVPSQSVVSVPLEGRLPAGGATSLMLRSDHPLVGAVLISTGAGKTRDLAWISATPPVTAQLPVAGAAAVPAGRQIITAVTVAAPGEAVYGTLTIAPIGTSAASIFGTGAQGLRSGEEVQWAPLMAGTSSPTVRRVRINVPGGSQRRFTLPGVAGAGALALSWSAEAQSGPGHLSHLSVGSGPLLTGYGWWPSRSAVPGVAVRSDLAVLSAAATRGR